MVDEKDVKIEFPCEYFIKVLMTADDDTRQLVVNTLDGHIESFDFEAHVTTKPSKNGTFESMTVTFWAHSESHIMTMFEDLKTHPGVKMVL
jgi:hypothetical protein